MKGVRTISNVTLNEARVNKNDDFYTQYEDIKEELQRYIEHFKDQIVYLNCDDPDNSNFWDYFMDHFYDLELKKLIATCYEPDSQAYMWVFDGDKVDQIPLKGDGDFRSAECMEILNGSGIIVTNPPFSLAHELLSSLLDSNKKFLIIGNQLMMCFPEVFLRLMDNKIWFGNKSGDMKFKVPDSYPPKDTRYWVDDTGQKWRSIGNICWYTNMEYDTRYKPLLENLTRRYNPKEYAQYDNYNAINIDRVADIPVDYDGIMGVPVTYLTKHNPQQFKIVGIARNGSNHEFDLFAPRINGKLKFTRVLIQRIIDRPISNEN